MFNPYKPLKKRRKQTKPKVKAFPRKPAERKPRLRFDQTRLGWQIRLHAPLEYDLIMNVTGTMAAPDSDMIENISYTSKNPFFRSQEFRKMLIAYRKNGCRGDTAKTAPTLKQLRQAAKQRRKMSKEYVLKQCE